MKKDLMSKLNRKEVNLTVCFYLLANDVERYVFYFYDPMYREPIDKWIYYLENGKMEDFKTKFYEMINDKKYKVNRPVTLCMCNKETKVNSIKLPKTLGFVFKYHKIIQAELEDKYGKDVSKEYFIDNKVDGLEEKDAEKQAKRSRIEAAKEEKKVEKLRKAVESREIEEKFEPPIKYTKFEKFVNTFSLIGAYLLIGISIFFIMYVRRIPFLICFAVAIGSISALFLMTVFILDFSKQKIIKKASRPKERFAIKDLFNFLLIASSMALLIFSASIWMNFSQGTISVVTKMVYAITSTIFIVLSFFWIDFKSKHLSKTYMTVPEFVKSLKREKVVDPKKALEEEMFFEGVTPKKLFSISDKKKKFFKNKSNNTVISFRQLLVSKYSYKCATFALKSLGLKTKEIRTLPSLINQFHLRFAKGVNEVVVYNEAGFTLFVGIVNDKIVESVFIEGVEKSKEKDGKSQTFHLQSFYNVFSSLLWSCQREAVRMDRVLFFANSARKISQIKDLNIFGLPYVVVNDTDALYGKSSKSIKAKLASAFTLVETVVAFSIFILVGLVVATLSVAISNTNRFTSDQNKANVYINNVREVLRLSPDNDTFEDITTYKLDVGEARKEVVYYVDYDFEITSASNSSTDKSYAISVIIEQTAYSDVSYAQNFEVYTITFTSIKRVNQNRNMIPETKIEVVK